jgi:hypothetical protein
MFDIRGVLPYARAPARPRRPRRPPAPAPPARGLFGFLLLHRSFFSVVCREFIVRFLRVVVRVVLRVVFVTKKKFRSNGKNRIESKLSNLSLMKKVLESENGLMLVAFAFLAVLAIFADRLFGPAF